jgi:hypothetical protein
MLSKGLIAPVLVVFVIILDLLVRRRDGPRLPLMQYRQDAVWAVGVFVVLAAPWYVANTIRDGVPFLEMHFLGGSTAWRYVGIGVRSQHLFINLLAFGPLLLVGCLPWTPLLPATVRKAWSGWKTLSPGPRLCAVWAAGGFAVLSLVPGARSIRYLLPLYPPLAILMASTVSGSTTRPQVARTSGWVALGLGILALVAHIATRGLAQAPQPLSSTAVLLPGAGPAFIGFGILTLNGKLRHAVAVLSVVSILAYGTYVWTLNQGWDRFWPWPRITATILEKYRHGDRIVVVGDPQQGNFLNYHLNGLTARSMSETDLVSEWGREGLFALLDPAVFARVAPRLRPIVLVRAESGWVLVSNR